MSHSIFHDFIIKSDKISVYKAVTEPQQLEKWWPLKCSGVSREGEVYNFNFTDNYDWYAKVVRCKEGEYIEYKMTESDKDWNPTTFSFYLKASNDGTLVSFSHINWLECNEEYKHSSFCWALLLNGLKKYLEEGVVVPFKERE